MKQRKIKFSLGLKIASILSCIALVSVGFASWWIVQLPDPITYENGSFTVYSVDTKNVKLENFAVKSGTEADVIFGKTTGVTERWLLSDSADKTENLKVTFTFDVNLYDNYEEGKTNTLTPNGNLSKFVGNIELDFASAAKAHLDAAIKANYITAPVISYSYGATNSGSITYNPDSAENKLDISMSGATSNTQQITLTIEFKWGEAFDTDGVADTNASDNLNPYAFYNAATRNSNGDSGVAKTGEGATGNMTWAEHAEKALQTIYLLNAGKYNLTLTAEVPNA